MEVRTNHSFGSRVEGTQGTPEKRSPSASDWSVHKRLKPFRRVNLFSFIVTRSAVVGVLLAAFLLLYHTMHPPIFSGWVQVVVKTGDSEWSIALDHCPNADTRDVVDVMEARNHIGGVIQPGEWIWVPTKASRTWLIFSHTNEK